MSRLYTVLSGLLILGGLAALIGRAWALSAILLVLGSAVLTSEYLAYRRRSFVPLDGGAVVDLERAKAQGLQNVQVGIAHNIGGSQF